MPVYGSNLITFDGINGDRYWFDEPINLTGVKDIDEQLSGFPVAIFLPHNRSPDQTPLVIGLQGMSAPYGWNAFIVPTLTQMGIAVALVETPFAGERSLVRTFTALVENEIEPLLERNIAFDTELLLRIFQCVARDIIAVRNFCCQCYGLTDSRLALFGVSMGVLQTGYAFTSLGIGDRLLGTIGHTNLQSFGKSWGYNILPDLAASPLGGLLRQVRPDLKPRLEVLQVAKKLKDGDRYSRECNPMTYVERVNPSRRARFLVGDCDRMVRVQDARACAQRFPDGACYVVPGLGHGYTNDGRTFVDHVRYFLMTQLEDWQG
ncbi:MULTISPECIES: alpha/beta hydrolase family protein [Nostocales]|uniref:Alpha/beta hydrolase n=3 Tax=Nostocales TaxID=1161 RepID=A0A0C1ND38_9CYAN|nr:hypothetical protein [Tolypothrix bouteillei]KAF3888404.1 alpha/beta hydrolase [Tolypothrix bouteillei VB521301]